jgi:mRNA-degrading endonuclease YafQ of YafQ-DinJ toxin-antitoxin module
LLKIQDTPEFIADFQAQLAQGKNPAPFTTVVNYLEKQLSLPLVHCDSLMVGTGRWCCLISLDWWLVYKCDTKAGTITFEQTGSFKYLFE